MAMFDLLKSSSPKSVAPTVKMETLCSRFYAVISGTSGDSNIVLLSLSVKWYANMMGSYRNISTKPTVQSFHFDCRMLNWLHIDWSQQYKKPKFSLLNMQYENGIWMDNTHQSTWAYNCLQIDMNMALCRQTSQSCHGQRHERQKNMIQGEMRYTFNTFYKCALLV